MAIMVDLGSDGKVLGRFRVYRLYGLRSGLQRPHLSTHIRGVKLYLPYLYLCVNY